MVFHGGVSPSTMDPPDPSHSPNRNFFDPTNLLGSSPFSPAAAAASNPYAHLAHLPSAFSLLGHHPGFPGAPPFGGLGSLDPLRSPGSVLSPTTGGADWWRAASDHARRAAGYGDVEYLVGALPPPLRLPGQQVISVVDTDSLYRPLDEPAGSKHLNGAYSSLFQLPTYTSAAAPTSTKSTTSSSHDKHHKKSDGASGSTPLSPHGKRSASPASSTSSHSSTSRKENSGKSSKHYESSSESKSRSNGPGAAAMSMSKYDEEVAKSLNSMFAFPDATAMLAPTMMGGPPLFGYPYGAGALFAAHHASLFGMPGMPGHPHALPFSMGAMSPPTTTSHSTLSASSKSTKTTPATSTRPSSHVAKSSSSSMPTSASKADFDSDRKSRKNLFGSEHHAPPPHPRLEGSQSSSAAAVRPADPKHMVKQRLPNHSSLRVPAASSDSDSLPGVSSDSFTDDSDVENDRDPHKVRRKSKKMPRLTKVPELNSPKSCVTGIRDGERARHSPAADPARPPTPDLVQDLSMKKRPASVSSHTSSSSHTESNSTSHKKDSVHHSSAPHKAFSSSTSTSSSSSSGKQPPPLISSPTSYPMPMHSSFADMTQHLFGSTAHLPPKLPMFFHPGAAMMAPMLDGSMSLLLPPPPSSAQAAAAGISSGRGGRGRSRGRGSRSGGTTAGSGSSNNQAQGSRRSRGRGRSRGGGGRGGRSSTSNTPTSSASGTPSAMDYAALSQLQEEHHQTALREHMEMQLKARQHMAALGIVQADPHQMAALQQLAASQDTHPQKEATTKLHQLADAHAAAASRSTTSTTSSSTDEKPSKPVQSSKMANALMGQLPTASQVTKSYTASKHSEATSDSDADPEDLLDSASDSPASSGSESETGESDVDAASSQDSETTGYKRPGEESDGATPRKRRRTHEIDETEIRIPLEHGWRRQTRLRGIGSRGLIGEVVYFAPCGKKLKTVPDVARYLEKTGVTDLTRTNFTFSTKVNVGDFLEARSEDGNSGYMALTEEEVVARFMLVATRKRAKLIAKQERAERRHLRKQQAAEMAARMAEMKMAKKIEQQEMTRRIAEMKMRRKMERQQAREAARREKQLRADELKKMKERERLMRQQEKVQRQEQMRVEREMRAQQIMEEKQRRKDELQRRLYEDALQKAKDREMKRQHAVMLKEQERERRRQHMLLVKALEARKRHEERERNKEEKQKEKLIERDRRMEQRRVELEMARELRKPVEDMLLNNHQEMPKMERIAGQCLAGEAFADCLMAVEFLHNFGTVLGFDDESLPTIQELHQALLNDEDEVEELVTVVTHLLRFAIDDPGFPNPKEAVTTSGLKILDLEVTEENMSEILRIFVRARNGKDDEMTDWLLDKPLLALTPTQKAACLAFLCNEMLSSRSIYGEIEKNIETLGDLRKSKWMAEGKVRKLRMIQAKKSCIEKMKMAEMNGEVPGIAIKKGSDEETEKEKEKDEEDDEEESGSESDTTTTTGNCSDEDEEMNLDELEKKIEKVNKQQITNDRKAQDCTNRLRAIDIGQDRFKRRYWVLPKAGGMFVEGLESAELLPEPEVDSDAEEEEKNKTIEGCEGKVEKDSDVKVSGDLVKVEEAKFSEDTVMVSDKTKFSEENRIAELKVKVERSEDHGQKTNEESSKDGRDAQKTVSECVKINAMVVTEAIGSSGMADCMKEEKMVNGVKEEQFVTKELIVGMHTNSKVDQLTINRTPMDESESQCVQVEMNGKRSDEAMVMENGEVKSENGLDLDKLAGLKHQARVTPMGVTSMDDVMKPVKAEVADLDMNVVGEKCVLNGGMPSDDDAFKVPRSASSLLITKADGINKLGDVLGTPPAALRTSSPVFSTPPISSLDIFKTAQNNNYSILNSHAEIASSFRSIDSILGSPDHKPATPATSSTTSTPVNASLSDSPTVFNSQFLSPQNILSSTPVSTEQMLKNLSQPCANDTWFSLMPRLPCDETSITHCENGITLRGSQGTRFASSYEASMSHCSLYATPPPGYPTSHRGSPVDYYSDRSLCGTPGLGHDGIISYGEVVDKQIHPAPKPIPKAMQRGWWRITSAEQLQAVIKCLHARGVRERCLHQTLERYLEGGTQNTDFAKDLIKIDETKLSQEVAASKTGAPEPDSRCGWSEEECTKAEAATLEEVEDLEERVFGASLQVKGCTLPSRKVTEDDETATRPSHDEEDSDDEQEPLERARQHLLSLEKNIERRYLKPPLAKGMQINLANLSGNTSLPHDDSDADDEEEDLPAALIRWRAAVTKAVSAAQLHLCVLQLNKCIAWEKSIMKVSCQICCKDDNEAELLLCDSCDKGYHTYCFRPKMEDIPDGDWYCCACISKVTGEPTCVVCSRKGPKIASCDHCSFAMHIECMDPPLPRVPRRYTCNTCASGKNKGKKRLKKPPPKVPLKPKTTEKSPEKKEPNTGQPEQPTPEKEKKGKKGKIQQQMALQQQKQQQLQKQKEQEQKQRELEEAAAKELEQREENEKLEKGKDTKKTEKKPDKRKGDKSTLRESSRATDKSDLTPCKTLLAELERHEEAWPFLHPVNPKQFPSYRKVIKHVMDVQTVKQKLRDATYNLRDEFAADVRLMFNNCQIFNEDESEVGQAGFILRSFFEKRWRELGCS